MQRCIGIGSGCCAAYTGLLEATDLNIWLYVLVPSGGVGVGLGLLMFWLMNKPTVADFLIAAEGEMKKVSWSSRRRSSCRPWS